MDQPSTGPAGLSSEGETSSGLQPILSSALFRTLFFFFFGGKQIAEEESTQPGGEESGSALASRIGGGGRGEVKAETQGRRHQPQPAPAPRHLLLIGTFSLQAGRQPFSGQSLRRQGLRGRPFPLLQGEIGTRHFILFFSHNI